MAHKDLIERLRRIAEALDVPLSAFLDAPSSVEGVSANELERLIEAFVQIPNAEDRAKVLMLTLRLAADSRN